MNRRILLVEPNYKNKYPPMGLMKISTYHKELGDYVQFYKGEFTDFILDDIYSDLLKKLNANDASVNWSNYKAQIIKYIQQGKKEDLASLLELSNVLFIGENFLYYHDFFKKKLYTKKPKWDRIYVTTLFTFHWKITIDTINQFKVLCKEPGEVYVGGIAASLVPDEFEKETGIRPIVGLLNKKGQLDKGNSLIIDTLPLDYSILYEIDYEYPENDGYYGYMTRGCVNKCPFCAVPKLEPEYIDYIGIKKQIEQTNEKFGERRHLLLLDNNVLASKKFDKIIDEIKKCGFTNGATTSGNNEYNLAIHGLRSGYNDRGYVRYIVKQYHALIEKMPKNIASELYATMYNNKLLGYDAKKEDILKFNDYFSPYFEKFYSRKVPHARYVDFNQGVDARLITEEKMKKLSEIPIRPLRIAFDSWSLRNTYKHAVELAVENGITNLSNYLLYNFKDKPIELYKRLEMNVLLADELNAKIYSFPMKYHPIQDPNYFKDRDYLGKYWNRKYIRAVQSILNSTKGKIGCGKSFFYEAFGKTEEEFFKLLYMPEAFLIYRFHFKENGLTNQWWEEYNALSEKQLTEANKIIENHEFSSIEKLTSDTQIQHLLEYYKISNSIKPDGYSKKKFI